MMTLGFYETKTSELFGPISKNGTPRFKRQHMIFHLFASCPLFVGQIIIVKPAPTYT